MNLAKFEKRLEIALSHKRYDCSKDKRWGTTHWHQCADCGHLWCHKNDDLSTSNEYHESSHKCIQCGKLEWNKKFAKAKELNLPEKQWHIDWSRA